MEQKLLKELPFRKKGAIRYYNDRDDHYESIHLTEADIKEGKKIRNKDRKDRKKVKQEENGDTPPQEEETGDKPQEENEKVANNVHKILDLDENEEETGDKPQEENEEVANNVHKILDLDENEEKTGDKPQEENEEEENEEEENEEEENEEENKKEDNKREEVKKEMKEEEEDEEEEEEELEKEDQHNYVNKNKSAFEKLKKAIEHRQMQIKNIDDSYEKDIEKEREKARLDFSMSPEELAKLQKKKTELNDEFIKKSALRMKEKLEAYNEEYENEVKESLKKENEEAAPGGFIVNTKNRLDNWIVNGKRWGNNVLSFVNKSVFWKRWQHEYFTTKPLNPNFIEKMRENIPIRHKLTIWSYFGKVANPSEEDKNLFRNLNLVPASSAFAFVFEVWTLLRQIYVILEDYDMYIYKYIEAQINQFIPSFNVTNSFNIQWQTYASKALHLLEKYASRIEIAWRDSKKDNIDGKITQIFAPVRVQKIEEISKVESEIPKTTSFTYGLGDGSKFVEEVSPILEKFVKTQYSFGNISLKGENGPIMKTSKELKLKEKKSDFIIFEAEENKTVKAASGSHPDIKEGSSLFTSLTDVVEEGEIFEHPFGPPHGLFVNDIRIKTFMEKPTGIVIPIKTKQTVKEALEQASRTNSDVVEAMYNDTSIYFEVENKDKDRIIFKNQREAYEYSNPIPMEHDTKKIVSVQIGNEIYKFKNKEIGRPLSLPQNVINFLYTPTNDFRQQEEKTKSPNGIPKQQFLFVERPGMGKTTMALLVFKRHWNTKAKSRSEQLPMIFAGPSVAIGSNFKREFNDEKENLGLNGKEYAGMLDHILTIDFRSPVDLEKFDKIMEKAKGRAVVVADEVHNCDLEDALCVNSAGVPFAPAKLYTLYFFMRLCGYDLQSVKDATRLSSGKTKKEDRGSLSDIVDVTNYLKKGKLTRQPANIIALMTATPMSSSTSDPGRFLSAEQKTKKFLDNGVLSDKSVVDTFTPVGAFLMNICTGGKLLDPSSPPFDPKGICTYTYALADKTSFTEIFFPLTEMLQKDKNGNFVGTSLNEWDPTDNTLASIIKVPIDDNGMSDEVLDKKNKDLSTLHVFEDKIKDELKTKQKSAKTTKPNQTKAKEKEQQNKTTTADSDSSDEEAEFRSSKAKEVEEDSSDAPKEDKNFQVPDSCRYLGFIAKPLDVRPDLRGGYAMEVESKPYMYSPKLAATAFCMCKAENSLKKEGGAHPKQLVLLENRHGFWLFLHVLKAILMQELDFCKSYSFSETPVEDKGQTKDTPSHYAAKMFIAYQMGVLENERIKPDFKGTDFKHNCSPAVGAKAVKEFDSLYNKQLIFYDEENLVKMHKEYMKIPELVKKYKKGDKTFKNITDIKPPRMDPFYPQNREFFYLENVLETLSASNNKSLLDECQSGIFPTENANMIKIFVKDGKITKIEVDRKISPPKIQVGAKGNAEDMKTFNGEEGCSKLGQEPCEPSQATICTYLTDKPLTRIVHRKGAKMNEFDPRKQYTCANGCTVESSELTDKDVIVLCDETTNKYIKAIKNKRELEKECCWGIFDARDFSEGASAFGTEFLYLPSTPSSGRNGLQRIFRGVRFMKISRSKRMKTIFFEMIDGRQGEKKTGNVELCDTSALEMLQKNLPEVLEGILGKFRRLGIDYRLKTFLEDIVEKLEEKNTILDQTFDSESPYANTPLAISEAALQSIANWLDSIASQCENQYSIVSHPSSSCHVRKTLEQCAKTNLFCKYDKENSICRSKMSETICNGIRDHMPLFLSWTKDLKENTVMHGIYSLAVEDIKKYLVLNCMKKETFQLGLASATIPVLDIYKLREHAKPLRNLFENAEEFLIQLNTHVDFKAFPLISSTLFSNNKMAFREHMRILCVAMVVSNWAFSLIHEEVIVVKALVLYFPILTTKLCGILFGYGIERYADNEMRWFVSKFIDKIRTHENIEKIAVSMTDPNFYYENVQYETVTHPMVFWSGFLAYVLFSLINKRAIEIEKTGGSFEDEKQFMKQIVM